ncbi:MAG: GGDEF domain-containing protein [Alkalimonas sp.]|nr:GGDEF domain-containing protein [Alkalimonas sp.]
MTEPQLLLSFIALLTAVAGAAWFMLAYPLRVSSKASLSFALTNWLVLLGVLLLKFRTEAPSLVHWFLADALVLLAFTLLHIGIVRLFWLAQRTIPVVILLLVSLLLLLMYQQGAETELAQGIIFSSYAFILFSLCSRDIFLALRENYGRINALLMAMPALLMALLFVTRTILLLVAPVDDHRYVGIQSGEGSMMLWAFVALTLTININIIGCAMVRLISRIRYLAERDQLTGLWNRRAMLKNLDQSHQSWLRHQFPYSLIWLDLDHFKKVNDRYGHDAGDAALKHCSHVLQQQLRDEDLLGRHGGEEFLIILPGIQQEGASSAAERLRLALLEQPFIWQSESMLLTASFGVITVQPESTPQQMLQQADAAMYQAKEAGRNCWRQYSGSAAHPAEAPP